MGLLDRIQSSRQQRSAGVPGGAVVDLTAGKAPAAPKRRQEWGRPGRCPDCDGPGYLDHIDMVDRIMFQHCKDCGHKWQVSQSQILAQS